MVYLAFSTELRSIITHDSQGILKATRLISPESSQAILRISSDAGPILAVVRARHSRSMLAAQRAIVGECLVPRAVSVLMYADVIPARFRQARPRSADRAWRESSKTVKLDAR